MKTCPVCGTTYDTRVDFCFRDGEVLIDAPATGLPGAKAANPTGEDEFDRPLPDTELPRAAPPRPPVPSAADLPQPRFVSSATDLPEPAFLQRETVAETAPFPTTPSPAPRAPIPDDETLPMPLEGGVLAPPVAPDPVPLPVPETLPEPVPLVSKEPDTPEVAAFVPPAEPAFKPTPAPLPPVQPAPEPELDAWATPEPPPRADEDEGGGGLPWGPIGLVALLLFGVGGFFVWRSLQTDPGPGPLADAGPALEDPAIQAPAQTEPENTEPERPTPEAAPDPDPEPVVAEVEPELNPLPEPTDPQPAVASVRNPGGEPREPSTAPATTPAAQPWDTPEPADTPQNGTIKINSVPAGATLFLDGKRVGTAPYSGETTQGRHKVRAEAEGYKPVEIMVSLNGELANANLTLQRDVQTQQVMLYGPAGAKSVRVAGQTINALPATISLPLGRHVFTVTQADGTSFQVSQSIAEGAQANVMLLPPE